LAVTPQLISNQCCGSGSEYGSTRIQNYLHVRIIILILDPKLLSKSHPNLDADPKIIILDPQKCQSHLQINLFCQQGSLEYFIRHQDVKITSD
jgi:hypothetical protein